MLEQKVAHFSEVAENSDRTSFYFKSDVLKEQKVTKHLGYFWRTICYQELSKIAESGHTIYFRHFSLRDSTRRPYNHWMWGKESTCVTTQFDGPHVRYN